ncbi:MAG: response regulator transcription factor [Bacteroidota bacterium]
MKSILLLEDDESFGALLKDYLGMKGYDAHWFTSGHQAMSFLRQAELDLCITDVMMPEMNGFEFASQVRKFKPDIPLIFLTARNEKSDQIRGFKTGADDYLCKPFDSELLVLKLEALLKRQGANETKPEFQQYQLGSGIFSTSDRTLTTKDHSERLSPKESQLLDILCQHMNQTMPRERALVKIWKDDTYFTRRSMDVYMAKLRRRFENNPHVNIVSLHSQGYRLEVSKPS